MPSIEENLDRWNEDYDWRYARRPLVEAMGKRTGAVVPQHLSSHSSVPAGPNDP